ncbi:MAG: type II toxin-antitoxin system VapC family toxin [Euryarchaeota archaeon]|nr:type II toxin-antitoxin system VapC family toxin [Euryarchaeota archaeon]
MILVDANIHIFASITEYPEHPAAVETLGGAMEEGIATTPIVLSEVFHQLYRLLGAGEARDRVSKILASPRVTYLELNPEAFPKAMNLSVSHRIRINDALIAQQALDTGIPVLTDNTRDFRRVEGLKVVSFRA